ncbi:MAG: MBL fold metallo-hydrolase [Desulfuromonadales bacterium]
MNLDHLVCFDLDQPALPGFRKFISSWLYRGDGCAFLVDPGPLSTIPQLLRDLRRRGVERLDYVLLTHIHIDHAGGAGALLREFPEARVVCHPEGMRHLAAPEKLWQGSLQVLGKTAEAYGEIVAVPENRFFFAEHIPDSGVRAFLTPGHAQHHACYLLDDLLFAGEVAGVRSEVADGIYMRPATPPRFIPSVALESIDRMLALRPRRMVFAHYGMVDAAEEHLRIARRQLRLWVRGVAETAAAAEAEREKAFFDWLQAHDPIFRNIRQLAPDLHARERVFFANTLRGMREFVESLSEAERRALSQVTD